MRDCPKCGSYVPEGKLFCPACGRFNLRFEREQSHRRIIDCERNEIQDTFSQKRGDNSYANDTYDYDGSGSCDGKLDLNQRVICAAAYFGILFIVPLFALPNSKEARFHANQGLVLFLFNLILSGIVGVISTVFGDVLEMLNVIYPLLMVYGAANALRGSMVEIPVIGKLRLIQEDRDMRNK